MSTRHPALADQYTADDARARWHDGALWFVRSKRDRAASVIPEWEALRTQAAAIKRYTLEHLDTLLEEFAAKASARGITVHWAADADEHNQIVHSLLEKAGVRRLVKSKSMLTEECHLNPYLEARGIRVVDTDLGERIVQLRHEPPSHIVLPAIHLKKEDVSTTFEQHLGTEKGNVDPLYLTRAARASLRTEFLEAQAGMTGVNFAIAETGGVVVCTNEGNADLGTALPPLHIACMGLEKIIPKLEHLGVFTRLLARSATGQAITTYTTHFHGPRPGAQMHVIIVDNGRSKLLASELAESMACIRCGACMNTCPVYRRSGGHSYEATVPGPIGSVIGPIKELDKHHTLPFACTLCGSCAVVCPVKIELPHHLLKLRENAAAAGHIGFVKGLAMKVAGKVLASPGLYRTASFVARSALKLPAAFHEHGLNPYSRHHAMPQPPPKTFHQLWQERQKQEKKP